MSLLPRAAGMYFLVAVCVGVPPASLPGARWALAGAWWAGAAPSGACCGFVGLDLWLVSLALVLLCAVVRHAVSCRVSPCCVVLARAVLRCAVLCRALLHRAVPCCAALCHIVPHRAVVCLVVVRCTMVRCGAVCRAASCCAVVGRWCIVRPVSWCRVRVGLWLAGSWGVRLGVGWLAGPVLWGSGCAARAGGSGGYPRSCPPSGLCLGTVPSGGSCL